MDRLQEVLRRTKRSVNGMLGAIAIVDDQEIDRKVIAKLIGDKGYNLILCSSGLELIDTLSSINVSLVITDMQMPVMDGIEVANMLKDYGIPCIMVSGYPNMDEKTLECMNIHVPFVCKQEINKKLEAEVDKALA